MKKLMQFLGFYGDDDYEEEPEEYVEKPRSALKKRDEGRNVRQLAPLRIVFFKGVPSERAKLRLREALLDGIMVLLDLHELDDRQFEEEGRPFIDFMGGVAFAHKGRMEYIKPALFVISPHEGMFEEWGEEEIGDVGSFDRQGR